MKTPVLILLLLMMLAPRLNAAPHALACAPAIAASTLAAASTEAGTSNMAHHHGHDSMAMPMSMTTQAEPEAQTGHHGNHAASFADITDSTALSADNGDDCEHCNQCEQHCSAVLPVDLPRQLAHHSSDVLFALTPTTLAGFASSLNRPPRTASI